MDSNPGDNEDLMPEELFQGISRNSRDAFSEEDIAEFLEKWADREGFVEDLEHLVDSTDRGHVSPEEVFEYLASSPHDYSVEEMLNLAEEWSSREWSDKPRVSSTGKPDTPTLGDKARVPRENGFIPLSNGYIGETEFREEDKKVWLQEHEEWYQTGVKPLDRDEFMELFTSLERISPAECLHEVNYGGVIYMLNSEDIGYFFEFRDDLDEFDEDIYRIESNFGDVYLEASRLPEDDERYRAMIFSQDSEEYPLDAYESLFSEQLVKGMKTKLAL